ncbi:hypothetical protein ACFWU3_10805 [Streptomyces sp. NPDC058685]|uniref:hypothetical protein n=1 Tax=Streptomyces sp. NPDC058685 TaxID=3346598 RepID=UPI003663DDAC
MQLHAEHLRALREPRKSAYVAYAECWKKRFNLIEQSWSDLYVADRHPGTQVAEGLLVSAAATRSEAIDMSAAMGPVQAVVYVEGPREVTHASVTASSRLVDLISLVRDSSAAVQNGEPAEEHAASFEPARNAAYNSYLDFLYAASDALGSDLLPSTS